MDIEEKQKIIKILEYIADEASASIEDSIVDIINEALEEWPVIAGCMYHDFKIK